MQFPSPSAHILPGDIPCVLPPPLLDQCNIKHRIRGSMLGLATGDALGASVEFISRQQLLANPVHEMRPTGRLGLKAGQWTDDTSMALCLASSLITTRNFDPYNQMVRYKWWYKYGYFSPVGRCVGSGSTTRQALKKFSQRQEILKQALDLNNEREVDRLSYQHVKKVPAFDVNCGQPKATGNDPLMRLAPVPLYYFRNPVLAVELSGQSARLTHGSEKGIDACRYYAALIVAALRGESKDQLLSKQFYHNHRAWFGAKDLCKEVQRVALGSYQKEVGYEMGMRGSAYIVKSLEAALWAFWSDGNSFQTGVLAAVNLGDDSDTTAAIYGQLAGAYYGEESIVPKWLKQLYAKDLIVCMSDWIHYLGEQSHLTVGMKRNMYYRVPTQVHRIFSNPTITMHSEMFGQVVPHPVNRIKKSIRRSNIHQPGLVWPQYQQSRVDQLLPTSAFFQRPHHSGQFYNSGRFNAPYF